MAALQAYKIPETRWSMSLPFAAGTFLKKNKKKEKKQKRSKHSNVASVVFHSYIKMCSAVIIVQKKRVSKSKPTDLNFTPPQQNL